jgi:small-conductance mechanosensitive channel
MRESKDVLPDPKADAVVIGFDQGSVTLRARWWSRSRIADVLLGQDQVLATARSQLAAAGIKLPSGPSPVVINALTGTTPAQSTALDSAPAPVLAKDQPDSSSE